MTGYQTGDNNQLEDDGTYSYEYNDEGNRTSRTNDTTDEVTEYEWDHRNRLTKVTEKDALGVTTQVVEYTYDVFNRRIAKEVDTTSPFTMTDAVIERYVYDDVTGVASLDGGNVVLDFVDPDGDGTETIDLERRYLYGSAVDQILAQEDVTQTTTSADRILWPLVDHLGTVRDLAKNDGTLGEHYEYDSYGNITSGDTSVTRYLFTSREYDADTSLQYNRARWYDAAVGRWLSEDPIGFAARDANVSRYVSNAPIRSADASGLEIDVVSSGKEVYGPQEPTVQHAEEPSISLYWPTYEQPNTYFEVPVEIGGTEQIAVTHVEILLLLMYERLNPSGDPLTFYVAPILFFTPPVSIVDELLQMEQPPSLSDLFLHPSYRPPVYRPPLQVGPALGGGGAGIRFDAGAFSGTATMKPGWSREEGLSGSALLTIFAGRGLGRTNPTAHPDSYATERGGPVFPPPSRPSVGPGLRDGREIDPQGAARLIIDGYLIKPLRNEIEPMIIDQAEELFRVRKDRE